MNYQLVFKDGNEVVLKTGLCFKAWLVNKVKVKQTRAEAQQMQEATFDPSRLLWLRLHRRLHSVCSKSRKVLLQQYANESSMFASVSSTATGIGRESIKAGRRR